MNVETAILLEARVDAAEEPGLRMAAVLLSKSLGRAANVQNWPVRILFRPINAPPTSPAPSAILVSLLPDMARTDELIDETEARWRSVLASLQASGAPIFVRTIFRHVAAHARTGDPHPVLERIRRLNRMAIALSHDLGAGIIDIDRLLAHIGGQILATDYHLAGALAAEASGYATALGLLSASLNEIADTDLQERAKASLGDIDWLAARMERLSQHNLQSPP